jgi:hypothetical protein
MRNAAITEGRTGQRLSSFDGGGDIKLQSFFFRAFGCFGWLSCLVLRSIFNIYL